MGMGHNLFDDFSLSRFGVDEADFYDNMTTDEQYELQSVADYIDTEMSYGGLYNAAEALEKKGIDPKQFIGSDGMYDRIALTKTYVDSEIKDLTNNGFITEEDIKNFDGQGFYGKQQLLRKGENAYYDSLRSPSYNSYSPQNPGNLTPQKTIEVKMQDVINEQGGMGRGRGNSLTQGGYMKGGRVGFSSGSERKRINSNMEPDYSNPFSKLNKIHTSKEKAFTNSLFKRNKKIVAAEKKRKRNLSISNEQARAKALQRLDLLKRLYASGKR